MKKVYASQNRLLVDHLKNILETHGIHSVIKNEYLWGAVGELPPNECWPELWVIRDSQYEKAREILAINLNCVSAGKPWRCSHCGEEIEKQFTDCWRCGESKYNLSST